MQDYAPKHLWKNPHVQTVLSSSPIRQSLVRYRSRHFLRESETLRFSTPDGIRLDIEITPNPASDKLAVLLHGWEGSAQSSYVTSLGNHLFQQNFSVARLNFRDHGDTHHLNRQPFNSVRLKEVAEAIEFLWETTKAKQIHIAGFSLGGNFALRLAARFSDSDLPLQKVIAICPAIDPVKTTDTIESGLFIYHRYFVKKWKNSLEKKYRYFPEQMRSYKDLEANTLRGMNSVFVPLHTDFDVPEEYLSAYRVDQETLNTISNDTLIVYAKDDPVIAAADFRSLASTSHVNIEAMDYGGHCAFLTDWRLNSWAIDRVDHFFKA